MNALQLIANGLRGKPPDLLPRPLWFLGDQTDGQRVLVAGSDSERVLWLFTTPENAYEFAQSNAPRPASWAAYRIATLRGLEGMAAGLDPPPAMVSVDPPPVKGERELAAWEWGAFVESARR